MSHIWKHSFQIKAYKLTLGKVEILTDRFRKAPTWIVFRWTEFSRTKKRLVWRPENKARDENRKWLLPCKQWRPQHGCSNGCDFIRTDNILSVKEEQKIMTQVWSACFEHDLQKGCPINFQVYFFSQGLFSRWLCELNMKDLWNIPSGMSDKVRQNIWIDLI